MKYFRELVEVASRDGILSGDNLARPKMSCVGTKELNIFNTSRPFVFHQGLGHGNVISETREDLKIGDFEKIDLAPPFRIFSIEVMGREAYRIKFDGPYEQFKVWCVVVVEKAPNTYVYYSLVESPTRRLVFYNNFQGGAVKSYLQEISVQSLGLESVRERVRVGSGANKQVITIRKVVHVRPKTNREVYSPQGRVIDWSHRWEVRGHWRSIQGLGKDREGQYCVENFTWVKEYEKGPEEAPLVRKVRVV